jgi:zinc transport system substrate-binding protein
MVEDFRMKNLPGILAGALFVPLAFIAMIAGQLQAQTVVASTSLTGAIAKAAGASEVRILTPAEAKHPPEYELKPSDLLKLEGANAVVYAGYERMVSRLAETSKNKNLVAIQVNTAMSPDNIIAQTRKVAAALHTEKQQQAWEKSFTEKLSGLKAKLAPFAGKSAVVHFQAQPFARWAGLSVTQAISPGEISPKAVADAISKRPDIVVDILHFPAARVIADNAHSRYALLINFPGVGGTATIDDVFEYNTMQIVRAFTISSDRSYPGKP